MCPLFQSLCRWKREKGERKWKENTFSIDKLPLRARSNLLSLSLHEKKNSLDNFESSTCSQTKNSKTSFYIFSFFSGGIAERGWRGPAHRRRRHHARLVRPPRAGVARGQGARRPLHHGRGPLCHKPALCIQSHQVNTTSRWRKKGYFTNLNRVVSSIIFLTYSNVMYKMCPQRSLKEIEPKRG
jgi:hypothetical protein